MTIEYYINGVAFSTDGVYVSASDGIIDALAMREPTKVIWPDHHGEVVDLSAPRYESRVIKLHCFIKASSKEAFQANVKTFIDRFQKAGTQRLMIIVDSSKPLVYEVYLPSGFEIEKSWSDSDMEGTFNLELRESEPLKKVYKFIATGGSMSVSVTMTTTDPVNISWGDGSKTYDVITSTGAVSHTYSIAGTYYIIISGVIENISSVTTAATLVWSKL